MKALRIERLGSREEFHFALHGSVDETGARALDRVLFECQARGAREVTLDFTGVTLVSTLGTAVLARQGRVYEGTERRIVAKGLAPQVRAVLGEVGAILYEENAAASAAPAPAPTPAAAADAKRDSPFAREVTLAADAVVATASTPSDVAALQSQLRRKIVEFRNLFEITRALNLALDLDEVLNLFSLSVMGQFGVERLALFLTDPDREGILSPRQVRGFAQSHFRDFLVPPDVIESVASEQTFFTMGDGEDGDESRESLQALRQSGLEWGVALRVRRDLIGVLFIGGRSGRNGFQEDERDFLTILTHQGAVAIANARFYRAQEERNLGLVRGMMALIESRDTYAKGSTERVVRYVTAVARLLNYPKDLLKSLIYGAVLRDIGMITVSGLILKNPAHLSEHEWALIKQHPIRGAQILEEMNFPKEVIEVVTNHHERWGGEGYPSGLKGHDIPLGARIVSLVDAYVAMTSERPYRRSLPYEKARQVIAENWGTPFDPAIVDVFLDVLEKIEKRSRLKAGEQAAVPDPNSSAEPAELDPLSAGATIPVSTESRP
ncbi:MAG TPA: HD domain-containing phosphohydrolase [Candidatus Eisenbacteria bacterium]|nr:HD domain-containing phosphohydrolase [Candidatus Eisenbacteria bacterium]